jgi:hypothetical protein
MTVKRFSLSSDELGWRFFHRLVVTCFLTAPFVLFVPILQSRILSLAAFVVLLLCVLLIIWLPFLKKVREIIIHEEEIQFVSFLRTKTVKLTDINWVEDVTKGLYTQVRANKEWFLVISDIEGLDEVVETIHAANPEIVIKRMSKPRDLSTFVGNWVLPLIVIFGLYLIGGPLMFSGYKTKSFNSAAQSDLRNIDSSQQDYYEQNKIYADSIDKLGYELSEDVTAFILRADEKHFDALSFHRQGNCLYVLEGPEGPLKEYIIGSEGGEAEARILIRNTGIRPR